MKTIKPNQNNQTEILKSKLIKAREVITSLELSIKRKSKVATLKSQEVDFIKRRIKEVYGKKALEEILNHVDCPMGYRKEV